MQPAEIEIWHWRRRPALQKRFETRACLYLRLWVQRRCKKLLDRLCGYPYFGPGGAFGCGRGRRRTYAVPGKRSLKQHKLQKPAMIRRQWPKNTGKSILRILRVVREASAVRLKIPEMLENILLQRRLADLQEWIAIGLEIRTRIDATVF